MTRIKVCGLTRREDVEVAVALGVDALGFILAGSPRQVTLDRVADLVEEIPPFTATVAVVRNPDREELQRVTASGLFTYLQFHGDESGELMAAQPLATIKAFGIASEEDMRRAVACAGTDYLLLDTRAGGKSGGTGRTFPWELVEAARPVRPFILAGGLGPENLEEALRRCRPAAVDLNSRVETSPGVKDGELLRRAVMVVRRAGNDEMEMGRRGQ